MTSNIIEFPVPENSIPAWQVEPEYSPALKAVIALVNDLSDEDTDELFSFLWAMGYGEVS